MLSGPEACLLMSIRNGIGSTSGGQYIPKVNKRGTNWLPPSLQDDEVVEDYFSDDESFYDAESSLSDSVQSTVGPDMDEDPEEITIKDESDDEDKKPPNRPTDDPDYERVDNYPSNFEIEKGLLLMEAELAVEAKEKKAEAVEFSDEVINKDGGAGAFHEMHTLDNMLQTQGVVR